MSDNVMTFPATLSFENLIERAMLYLAFDRYVLEDAILEQELADAETKALEFRDCVAGIDASLLQGSLEERQQSFIELRNCLIDIDPDLANQFGFSQN